jgi:hypothetical protein
MEHHQGDNQRVNQNRRTGLEKEPAVVFSLQRPVGNEGRQKKDFAIVEKIFVQQKSGHSSL